MSFFIRPKGKGSSENKRKAGRSKPSQGKGQPSSKRKRLGGSEGEEIPSDSDSDRESGWKKKAEEYSSSEEEEETAQEKRLRLAKQYLSQIEAEEAERRDDDDEEIDRDAISHRLKEDVLEQSGKLHRKLADRYLPPEAGDIILRRGHQLSATCVVISPDDRHVFSASKDCSIIKWSVAESRKVKVIPGGRKGTEDKHVGHTAHVLCLAVSSDGRFLASGDRNKLIHIWNPDTCERMHTFTGHRDAVSALAFRKGTHQLFSGSHDRSVKIWNLDEMAYVETLFGHEDVVTGIDSLSRDRAVTTGGRDKSVRIWKVVEESQLVFHGHMGSIDCVSLINEEHIITGADDNSLALWHVMKKKPVTMVTRAHSGSSSNQKGDGEDGVETSGSSKQENWITAVASFQHTDLIASAGSRDGSIKLWKCAPNFRALRPLFSIPVAGFINGLRFASDGSFLVAAVGQEHRLGRWWSNKAAKNGICIIKLKQAEGPTQTTTTSSTTTTTTNSSSTTTTTTTTSGNIGGNKRQFQSS